MIVNDFHTSLGVVERELQRRIDNRNHELNEMLDEVDRHRVQILDLDVKMRVLEEEITQHKRTLKALTGMA